MNNSAVNTVLLSALVAIAGFIAVQVWTLSTKQAAMEIQMAYMKITVDNTAMQVAKLETRAARKDKPL